MVSLRISITTIKFIALANFLVAATALAIPTASYNNVDYQLCAILQFPELARGGSLVIANLSNDEREEIVISVSNGESHDSVSQKISDILLSPKIPRLMPSVMFPVDYDKERLRKIWESRGAVSISGIEGEIILGGTETGLGILPPAGSVSASYDKASRSYKLRWHERSNYDEVYLRQLGTQWHAKVKQSDENYVSSSEVSTGSLMREVSRPLYVVGFREGLPTNASYIIASENQQVDSFFHPFTGGLTTNWTGWRSVDGRSIAFAEQRFSESLPAPPVDRWKETSNRSAQIIQTKDLSGKGGMYRFFIAQTPGRIYRPALRCHIVEEAEGFGGEWAFEIMTGVIDPERAYEMDYATWVLDEDAWTKFESSGAQISKWRFDHTMARTDEWIMNQTGAQESDVLQKDIVLGESKTAVFFYVRLTGHKPNGIAIDGVRLVDVTDGFADAKIRKKAL